MTRHLHFPHGFRLIALCSALLVAAAPAHAGLFDSLFGGKSGEPAAARVDAAQRTWRIGEFTTVQIVAAEPGAAPNQHPARLTADVLRWQLGGIRATLGNQSVNLFAADEINDFAEPLAQAFSRAGPGDDVLLISSSRRGASIFTDVTAVTARLFVQDGALQFIVRDTRLAFVKEYISSRSAPKFSYGSRAAASPADVSNSGATSRRPDWLVLGLTLPGAAAPAPLATQPAPAAAPSPAAAATPRGANAAAAPAAPALEPLQTEAEHRLATLKRLRDRGLISEEEFQEKRKDVLKQL